MTRHLYKSLKVLASLAFLLCLSSSLPAQHSSPRIISNHFASTPAAERNELKFDDFVIAAGTASGQPLLKPPMLLVGRESGAEPQSAVSKAIRESERHFQSGKFLLQESKPEEARREFDLAVDLLLDLPEDTPERQVAERRAEELVRLIHRYSLESFGAQDQETPKVVQSPLPAMLDMTFPIDPAMTNKVLAQVAATSSQLPLVVNDAVLSYVNYFTSERGRKVLYAGLRRSGRYKPMISRILDEEGVPQELIFLAQAESAFMPQAVSRAAAVGMWQFVRFRGKEYGLAADKMSDERLDPEKATRAAARHLHDLYRQLGDWHLAMAAYNCGPFCVERAVQRTGYADYWELRARNALPRETRNYVPAILAMAIVSKNLAAYGLEPVIPDQPLECDTIQMTADTSLALVADAADLPVSDIRDLNPSLLRGVAPAGYQVKVPHGRGNVVLAALDTVPGEKRRAWRLHRVTEGETLASIARRYSTAASSIVAANPSANTASISSFDGGEILLIPALAKAEPAAKASRTRGTAAHARAASTRRTPVKVAATSARSASRKPVAR
ncbi:MAG: transglycosylase SLT domain-containing protein [Acidobacteria bacterium]|nr:transglycosylase SLT domain-containing protein [Acidobacteriota bacterium]